MTVQRGDIYYADLPNNIGAVQSGVRPVLVIQNDVGNKFSPTTIVAPLTSNLRKKRLPTHVLVEAEAFGLRKDSVVLLEQIMIVDKTILKDKLSFLDEDKMEDVDQAIGVSLGLVRESTVC